MKILKGSDSLKEEYPHGKLEAAEPKSVAEIAAEYIKNAVRYGRLDRSYTSPESPTLVRPLKVMGQAGVHLTGEVASGVTLGAIDIAANKLSGGKYQRFSAALDKLSGFEPTDNFAAGSRMGGQIASFVTAGLGTGAAVGKIPARLALRRILGAGLTFGTVEAAGQFSDKVIQGKQIDWRQIHFQAGLGTLIGVGAESIRLGVKVGKAKYLKHEAALLKKNHPTLRSMSDESAVRFVHAGRDFIKAQKAFNKNPDTGWMKFRAWGAKYPDVMVALARQSDAYSAAYRASNITNPNAFSESYRLLTADTSKRAGDFLDATWHEKGITAYLNRPTYLPSEMKVPEHAKLLEVIGRLAKRLKISSSEVSELSKGLTGIGDINNLKPAELRTVALKINSLLTAKGIGRIENSIGLTPREAAKLRAASKTPDKYISFLRTHNVKLPDDEFFRKNRIDDWVFSAKKMAKYSTDSVAKDLYPEPRVTRPINWASSRNYFSHMQEATGAPLLNTSQNLEHAANLGTHKAALVNREMLRAARASELKLMFMPKAVKDNTVKFLFTGDQGAYRDLPDNYQRAALAMKNVLQGPSANAVRGIRWRKWFTAYSKEKSKIMQQILSDKPNKRVIAAAQRRIDKFKPVDAPDVALADGIDALKEGVFDEWIAGQTWGTKEIYYMSDLGFDKFADDTLELTKVPNLEAFDFKAGLSPIDYSALHTRKGKPDPLLGKNPYIAVKNHVSRVMRLNAMYDALERFDSTVRSVSDLHQEDAFLMSKWRDSIIGKYTERGPAIRAISWVTRQWWRFWTLQPSNPAWFAARNVPQNLGVGLGQFSSVEASKGMFSLLNKGPNEWMMPDFKEKFPYLISQKKSMWDIMTMRDLSTKASTEGTGGLYLLDLGSKVLSLSDELNRWIPFFPVHQSAYNNLALWRNKKISTASLFSRLKMDTLNAPIKERLVDMLEAGNDKAFVTEYVTAKIENTHYVYRLSGRSMMEQFASTRPLLALMTWPRGAAESYYQNGIKPLYRGLLTGNIRKSYEGLKHILLTWTGLALAGSILAAVVGSRGKTKPYGELPTGDIMQDVLNTIRPMIYTPGSPGLGWLANWLEVPGRVYDMKTEGSENKDIYEYALKKTAYQLEAFVPLCDVMKTHAQNANNVEGARLWHVLKQMAIEDYKIKYDKELDFYERSTYEKALNYLFRTKQEMPKTKESKSLLD